MASLNQDYAKCPGSEDYQTSEIDLEAIECGEGLLSHTGKTAKSVHWRSIGVYLTTICLLIIIVIQNVLLYRLSHEQKALLSPIGLSRERSVNRTVFIPSVYLSENQTEQDLAWDFISPGFGIVALTPEYAGKLSLPDSLPWKEDRNKSVYVVEAYHAIHCTRIIRQHYLALLHGTQWEWSVEHDLHCLDGLRQYIMCNPDDTLLWSTGHRDAGHGQKKKCQSWDALRDWTAQHTISYFDYEHGHRDKTILDFHAGDGLPVGDLFGEESVNHQSW